MRAPRSRRRRWGSFRPTRWSRHSRRRVPMSRSTYGFCQGDRAAVLTSWIPMDCARLENATPYTAPRARRRYRGAVCQGQAPPSCWAVHWAVGASVTLMWTTRRRSCARTTKTNSTLHVTLGRANEHTEARARWVRTPRRRPVRIRVIMPAIIDQAGRPFNVAEADGISRRHSPLGRDRGGRLLHQRGLDPSRADHLLHALRDRSP